MKVILIAKPLLLTDNLPEYIKERKMFGSDGEILCEIGGRVCYDSFKSGRQSEDFHHHIKSVGHGSIYEHAVFAFYISGISRGLTHELIRHRVGIGISQESTRYVDKSDTEYVLPPLFRINTNDEEHIIKLKYSAIKIFNQEKDNDLEAYTNLFNIAMKLSNDRKTARGAARSILATNVETKIIWSANIRTIRNVIEQRGSLAADQEIREFARELYNVMIVEAPFIFDDYDENLETQYKKI